MPKKGAKLHAGQVLNSTCGISIVNIGIWLFAIAKGLILKSNIFIDLHTTVKLSTCWVNLKPRHLPCSNKSLRFITISNHNMKCYVHISTIPSPRSIAYQPTPLNYCLLGHCGITTLFSSLYQSTLQHPGWLQYCCSGIPHSSGTAVAASWDEVEQILSNAFSFQFTIAHASAFLQPPLAPLVGPYSISSTAQEILQGTFICPPGTDDATHYYIEALQFPSHAAHQKHILAILQPEDFICHWCHEKDHTSVSHSDLHCDHYKVVTQAPNNAFFMHHLFSLYLWLVYLFPATNLVFKLSWKKGWYIHDDNLWAILLMKGDLMGQWRYFSVPGWLAQTLISFQMNATVVTMVALHSSISHLSTYCGWYLAISGKSGSAVNWLSHMLQ